MNRWDYIAFLMFFLALLISFGLFEIPRTFMAAKYLLFAIGGYCLWYKGVVFKVK